MRILCLFFSAVFALPGDDEIREALQGFKPGDDQDFPCIAKECRKPTRKFERISITQPGYQWMDAGGYCGAWSIQRAVMAKGAWISQQQVRNHTVPGGGHEEILATNIDVALKNLKIAAEGFDYKNLPVPQVDTYRKWIKKQLMNGHTLVCASVFSTYGPPCLFWVNYPWENCCSESTLPMRCGWSCSMVDIIQFTLTYHMVFIPM